MRERGELGLYMICNLAYPKDVIVMDRIIDWRRIFRIMKCKLSSLGSPRLRIISYRFDYLQSLLQTNWILPEANGYYLEQTKFD